MRAHLIAGGGIALVEPAEGDEELMRRDWDDAFDVDPGEVPGPPPVALTRAAVVDAATGELLGQVSWHQVAWGRTLACAAWNIGIGLLPAARGRGAGAWSFRLMARHLFATTDVDRVEGSTDVENTAARRAFLAAGFHEEGVVRGAQLRGGVRRDLVMFGLLRSDMG